jgi:hypothetical protein
MDRITAMAEEANIPVSDIIDEAITFYLDSLKEPNGK